MKKSLVALALMGAFAGAHAQSSVVIYGTIDAGIAKTTGTDAAIGKRDNNKLGFRGVEDLGSGLKALFHLEIRYEPDVGTLEQGAGGVQRPLFQGQSRVGLQGNFGTVRIGRGLTPFQESITAFEPWNGLPAVAGFQTNLQVAGFNSDPLGLVGNSTNRFSNAVWYNTPVFNGFQVNVAVATKEANNAPALIGKGTALAPQYPANSQASANPFSTSATYTNGPFAAMAAYERNAVESKLWSVAGSYKPLPALKLMASYQKQDQGHTIAPTLTRGVAPETASWVIGANYTVGAGKILMGYGQKDPDNTLKTKQISLGYEYNISARTYIYVDASNKKQPLPLAAVNDSTTNHYSLGIHHNF